MKASFGSNVHDRHFKKRIIVIALVASGCLAVVAAGTAASAAPLKTTSKSAKVALKPIPRNKTIGVVDEAGVASAQQRCKAGVVQAAKAVHWNVDYQDANRDPTKALAIVQGFVAQNVSAIVTLSVPQGWIAAGLSLAKEKGIPVIATCGGMTPPYTGFSAVYTEDESKVGVPLANQIVRDVTARGGGQIAIVDGSWAPAGAYRSSELKVAVSGTKVQIVADTDIDPTNFLGSVQKITQNDLAQFPNLKAIMVVFDTPLPTVVQTVQQAGKASQVKVYGFYAEPTSLPLLRTPGSPLQAVAEAPLLQSGMVAVDQLINHFVNNKPINRSAFNGIANARGGYYVVHKGDRLPAAPPNGVPDDWQLEHMTKIFAPFLKSWHSQYRF